jgi:DNA end-binding protein Ku
MASRPVGNGNISFGLVSIPVRLFPATRSKSVSFNLLHAKDLSRIQQKIFCPIEGAIIDRSELVRGYEVAKDRYVTFTDEELKALETRGGDHSIEITEFVPRMRAGVGEGLSPADRRDDQNRARRAGALYAARQGARGGPAAL